ncbi:MAG: hypothetical protein ACON5B_04600 [Myxococcota bacterium]
MLMLLVTSIMAVAAEPTATPTPTVQIDENGVVVGRMLIDAPPAEVRAAVQQMHEQESPGLNVLSVDLKARGNCQTITRTTRGLMTPLKLETQRCPTEKGWREWLVASKDFTTYDVEWDVTRAGAGTEVHLRVNTQLAFSAPTSLVQMGTRNAIRESLADVIRRVLKPRSKTP